MDYVEDAQTQEKLRRLGWTGYCKSLGGLGGPPDPPAPAMEPPRSRPASARDETTRRVVGPERREYDPRGSDHTQYVDVDQPPPLEPADTTRRQRVEDGELEPPPAGETTRRVWIPDRRRS